MEDQSTCGALRTQQVGMEQTSKVAFKGNSANDNIMSVPVEDRLVSFTCWIIHVSLVTSACKSQFTIHS
jgi:hypothetical protein